MFFFSVLYHVIVFKEKFIKYVNMLFGTSDRIKKDCAMFKALCWYCVRFNAVGCNSACTGKDNGLPVHCYKFLNLPGDCSDIKIPPL